MGHFVEDGVGAAFVFPGGGAGAENIVFAVGDTSYVFHGAGVEVGDEYLVVGSGEGVEDSEGAVVVVEAALG